MHTTILITCLSLTSLAFGQSVNSDSVNSEYIITSNEKEPLRILVEAKFKTRGDTLYMNPNCPNYDYPEGWSSFIKNLSISSSDNEPISYHYQTKSKWVLENKASEIINVTYEVDLSFTNEKWEVGNEQAGFFDGKAIYLVSKALFIYPVEDGKAILRIHIPDEWKLSVPWESTQSRTYDIPSREFLIENSLVFGDYYSAQLRESGFDFRIALLGKAEESGDLFSMVLQKVAKAYLHIFKDTPPTIYLITVFYADLDDGESFYNSNTFTLKNTMDEDNKIIWANQMAHELFHYWNSDLMHADNYAERQWFSEGTAEYYANLTLVREGIIDESLFRSKMEKILALYQNFRGWRERETSLLKAGENKGRNRFLVYNGGWAVAMALDVTIMENTHGNRTLDDFMETMFNKYSSTSYSYQDLVHTANEVAGVDLNDFFAKYVGGTDLLPMDEYLDKLGYRMLDVIYEAEMYLIPQSGIQNLRDIWFRKNIK